MNRQITTEGPAFYLLPVVLVMVLTLVTALMLASCTTDRAADTASGEKVVNVYNWADYIAPDTLQKFEA